MNQVSTFSEVFSPEAGGFELCYTPFFSILCILIDYDSTVLHGIRKNIYMVLYCIILISPNEKAPHCCWLLLRHGCYRALVVWHQVAGDALLGV